ncbi:MAG: 3-oxoacyl-ACP reductase FabG [Alphaproteobacteria bacterium]|nr:3-oxoacyl-ACP reductase FabG [Alphaproteobacteria bacterium]
MKKLKDKIALITGASSGIGAGVAVAYAKEGADIVLNYFSRAQKKDAAAVAVQVRKAGRRALLIEADVSAEAPVRRMVAAALKKFGRIDILVNNAGISTRAPIEDLSVAQWDEMIRVNLRSVFLCTHYVLPHMYARNYGKIINTASQLAYAGTAGGAHYAAAKGGIISFTRSLAKEVGPRNINANCVAPGATVTPMVKPERWEAIKRTIPKGRLARIDQIVPAYVFLASDEADHMVGQTVSPNGGDVML